jgi:hypothetical protein
MDGADGADDADGLSASAGGVEDVASDVSSGDSS